MTVALILKNPLTVIDTFAVAPANLLLPDGSKPQGAKVGWDNGSFALVAVTPFVTPAGRVKVGHPTYLFVGNDVVESFPTEPEPPNPDASKVPWLTFLGRMADKVVIVNEAAQQDRDLLLWIEQARQIGYVDVASDAAQQAKVKVVSIGLFSASEAEVLFAAS